MLSGVSVIEDLLPTQTTECSENIARFIYLNKFIKLSLVSNNRDKESVVLSEV